MTSKSSRRTFMGQSAALGAAFWVGGQKSAKALSPLQSLSAGCIGVGGKGDSDSSHVYEHGVSLAGICDIDEGRLKKKGRQVPDAKQYTDYREMLDSLGDKLAFEPGRTPDPNHA